jgi:hypothetical protein
MDAKLARKYVADGESLFASGLANHRPDYESKRCDDHNSDGYGGVHSDAMFGVNPEAEFDDDKKERDAKDEGDNPSKKSHVGIPLIGIRDGLYCVLYGDSTCGQKPKLTRGRSCSV